MRQARRPAPSEDLRSLRRHVRARLAEEAPALLRLLSEARGRVATRSRGLSEEVEGLVQLLASVRTKVDRMQRASSEELAELAQEIEEGWEALKARASRIRAALDED